MTTVPLFNVNVDPRYKLKNPMSSFVRAFCVFYMTSNFFKKSLLNSIKVYSTIKFELIIVIPLVTNFA